MNWLATLGHAQVDTDQYARVLTARAEGLGVKLTKALDDDVLAQGGSLAAWVDAYRATRVATLDGELATQRDRQQRAQAKLASSPTKTATNELRISTDKIGKLETQRADLARTVAKQRDGQIFPQTYAAIIAADLNGTRWVRPMRYLCRPSWAPPQWDVDKPGAYNARRDSLDAKWRGVFGKTHALMVVSHFWENVDRDGSNQRIEFWPSTGEPMLVPCLWSHWTDSAGVSPDLMSFAAVTDDPEPEVAATGHDRTIVNLKPEHVAAWLSPSGRSAGELHALLADKRHPFYEHRDIP